MSKLTQVEKCNQANRAFYIPVADHMSFIERFLDVPETTKQQIDL